jgi:hypothetical protein
MNTLAQNNAKRDARDPREPIVLTVDTERKRP